ncbi:MAG: TIGR00341 family protein, partial [Anaerohalosphaera sp.]|nr:TIGR00341 family protein [Anaerohalosphaera sp.]
PGFRIVIVAVEATIPRIEKPKETEPEIKQPLAKKLQYARVSREELHNDILESSQLSWLFVVMVALSSVVAAIGLLRNNAAVVIGAMVIAPLLGPNVALALASTLGDVELARTARKSNIVGIALPLVLAALTGMIFANGTLSQEIISRTEVNLSDIVLALAAGCAATLSFTMAMSGTLIGVMVAVALLPPLVTFGILLGCAEWQLALGAGLLFATNLICINLAGVMTFLAQGVRPLWWWDKQRAKKATKQAMITWLICLAILIILIIASQKWILK